MRTTCTIFWSATKGHRCCASDAKQAGQCGCADDAPPPPPAQGWSGKGEIGYVMSKTLALSVGFTIPENTQPPAVLKKVNTLITLNLTYAFAP